MPEAQAKGKTVISRRMKQGFLGVNINALETVVLIQATEDDQQARVVLTLKQAEEFLETLARVVDCLRAEGKGKR